MQQKSSWDLIDNLMQFGPQQGPQNHVMMASIPQSAPVEMPVAKPAPRQMASIAPIPQPQQMAPPQVNPAQGIQESFLNDLTNRQAYVRQLQERLMAQPQGQQGFDLQSVNLKPMLAYADSLMGTNTAQSYTAPTAKKDLERMKLQALADKESQALSDDKLNFLKLQETIASNGAKMDAKDEWLKTWARLKEAELGFKKNKEDTKELSQPMIKNLNEGNAIPGMLEDIDASIGSNTDLFDPIKGPISAANPYNERSRTLNAQFSTASQAFGRFMEGGVLRKEDEEKYRKMFPQIGDTPQVAKNKLDLVRRQLINKQQSDLSAFRAQGYDLSGLDGSMSAPEVPSALRPVGGPKTTTTREVKPPPRVGTIQKGYRYKGGDPNNSQNWEKVN